MQYREIKGDLFKLKDTHVLAHCISSDFKLGVGIANEFDRLYRMRTNLISLYPNHYMIPNEYCALRVGNVYNLVTKHRYFEKPTYNSLRIALDDMRDKMVIAGQTQLAMPMIGSGLDKLAWRRVSEIIKEIFEFTDIDITICVMKVTAYKRGRD